MDADRTVGIFGRLFGMDSQGVKAGTVKYDDLLRAFLVLRLHAALCRRIDDRRRH